MRSMRSIGRILIGLSIAAFIVSCGMGSYESRGNSAYSKAQRLKDYEKRMAQKTAYTWYQKALQTHPEKISNTLRSRFVEMSLVRAKMVLDEGTAHSDPIRYFMADIEKYLTPDAASNLRQEYALFLIQLADSFSIRQNFNQALATIDKAISYASDPSSLLQVKRKLVGSVAKENFELAGVEFENAKQNKDADARVRAEYYCNLSLFFEPENKDAIALLSELHKANLATYSGYLRVIENIQDSVLFRKINKFDILLAVSAVGGDGTNLTFSMRNYSYNPLRMKSENFFIADDAGKRYKAFEKKLEPEILDQEREAPDLKLSFPKPAGKVVKLIYENGPHYTEKCFF
jgi:hypothetical protein